MIDRTQWAIVQKKAMTESGKDEVVLRTVFKYQAQQALKLFVPDRHLQADYKIVKHPRG